MKNRNHQLTAVLFVVALALAPIVQAAPRPDGGPTHSLDVKAPRPDGGPIRLLPNQRVTANSEESSAHSTSPEGENRPVVSIHSTDNVNRGKIGSFVLNTQPVMFGGMYVNFSVSGSAIPGVDYVPLISPTYVASSGYGVILIQTLPDPRGSSIRRAYDVVITLEPAAGYWVGQPSSARMWIRP
jgi:hypothetical protein